MIPVFYPALAPGAAFYAALARHERAGVAMLAHFDKRCKQTHRYDICDTRGRLALTVPIVPPHGIPHARWTDIAISGHGRWQSVHAVTLASAYGRTPFYEYYIDRLRPALLPDEGTPLAQQIMNLNSAICSILLIDTAIDYNFESPSVPALPDMDAPYWQIRRAEHGFIPGLSVLDLIFNLGPEAALYIRRNPTPDSATVQRKCRL